MDNAPRKRPPLLRLVKDEPSERTEVKSEDSQNPKPKSAFARQLTSFADDLDAQIALLLAQD